MLKFTGGIEYLDSRVLLPVGHVLHESLCSALLQAASPRQHTTQMASSNLGSHALYRGVDARPGAGTDPKL